MFVESIEEAVCEALRVQTLETRNDSEIERRSHPEEIQNCDKEQRPQSASHSERSRIRDAIAHLERMACKVLSCAAFVFVVARHGWWLINCKAIRNSMTAL